MPRSGREARERLETAAFELFLARGFDSVTTAEIAERAGVTERTFFRHFPDKREVLFDGERRLVGWLSEALSSVADEVPVMAALGEAIRAIVPRVEANAVQGDALARIAAATPAVWERAAAKEARLVAVVGEQLEARGASPLEAEIAARTTWGGLSAAVSAWRRAPQVGLQAHVDEAFNVLSSMALEVDAMGGASGTGTANV